MYIYQKVVLFLNVQRSNKHYFFVNRGILRILWLFSKENHCTKKWIFSTKNFFVKSDQIRSFLWIWSHLLKKSLMEKFIFCPVNQKTFTLDIRETSNKLHQTKYWHFVLIFLTNNISYTLLKWLFNTAWKVSKYEVSSGTYFLVFGHFSRSARIAYFLRLLQNQYTMQKTFYLHQFLEKYLLVSFSPKLLTTSL